VRALVGDVGVDLVGEHPEIVAARHLVDDREELGPEDGAIGVARRHEVDGAGARPDSLVEARAEPVGGERRVPEVDRDLDARRALGLEDPRGERPVRRQQHDLVARIEQHPRDAVERVGASGAEQHLVGPHRIPAARGHVAREGLAERREPARRAITKERGVLAHEGLAGLGRREHVGVPDVERDERLAGARDLGDPLFEGREHAFSERRGPLGEPAHGFARPRQGAT
jgi:hypothetical protein